MFPSPYFPLRYFAPGYFPREGVRSVLIGGPYRMEVSGVYRPGPTAQAAWIPGASVAGVFVPGVQIQRGES